MADEAVPVGGQKAAPGGAAALAASGALALAAYLYAALARLDLDQAGWAARAAVIAWAALPALLPLPGACAVFLVLPLFGNHPGGRLMEILDVGVAASTVGLSLRALRLRRPAPGGVLWGAAALLLVGAALSVIPTLPAVLVWAAQVDDWRSTLVQALTASDTIPLYSLASLVQLLLAAAWAYALCWSGADRGFVRSALRCVAVGLLAVMVVGALDYHGLVDLRRDYLVRIDPLDLFPGQFRSIFWNPGWFAWHFSLAFGLSLGLLWCERRWRALLAGGLVFCYGYFLLLSTQRGGLLAVHAALLTALLVVWRRTPAWRHRPAWLAAGLVAALALAAVVARTGLAPQSGLPALRRLVTIHGDVNRRGLWLAAWRMWREAPVLGVGEASFGWRLRDFVPAGSRLDVGRWGDAHNEWLQLLATRGLVGLAAFLALLVALAGRVRQALRLHGLERGLGLSLLFGLVAFLAYSLVQCLFYLQATQVLFWGMVALGAATVPSPPGRRRYLPLALALLALVLVGGAAEVRGHAGDFRRAAEETRREPRGFYPLQQPARRWSSRRGTLCLYPTAPVMTLELSTADPRAREQPVTVTLRIGGRLLDRLALRQRGVAREYFVPSADYRPAVAGVAFGECVPALDPLAFTVEVDRPWSPKSSGAADGRILGVMVFPPSFRGFSPGEAIGLSPPQLLAGRPGRSMGGAAGLVLGAVAAGSEVSIPVRVPGLDAGGRPVVATATLVGSADPEASRALSLADDGWHDLRIRTSTALAEAVLALQVDRIGCTRRVPLANDASACVGLEVGEVACRPCARGRCLTE